MTYELGILGGMGTFATTVFFERLYNLTKAEKDQDHINALILNHASMPDRTEAILKGGEKFLETVREDFEIFNRAKVKYIVIPCNTSHYFIDEMEKMTEAEIINMPYETVKFAKEKGKDLMLFATAGTVKGKVYEKYARELHIPLHYPTEAEEKIIMDTIYKVKETGNLNYPEFEKLIEKYRDEYTLIMGCTELSLLDYGDSVDAMDVLIKKTLEKCGKL